MGRDTQQDPTSQDLEAAAEDIFTHVVSVMVFGFDLSVPVFFWKLCVMFCVTSSSLMCFTCVSLPFPCGMFALCALSQFSSGYLCDIFCPASIFVFFFAISHFAFYALPQFWISFGLCFNTALIFTTQNDAHLCFPCSMLPIIKLRHVSVHFSLADLFFFIKLTIPIMFENIWRKVNVFHIHLYHSVICI